MHSLDYKVINKVVENDASIPTFFHSLLQYSFSHALRQVAIHRSTPHLMIILFSLWQTDKKLYDWTVNDENVISKSLRLGVDGIITDDVQLYKQLHKELQK